jgi:hypothetical protein
VCIDRHVVLPTGCPETMAWLHKQGYTPHPVELDEFLKWLHNHLEGTRIHLDAGQPGTCRHRQRRDKRSTWMTDIGHAAVRHCRVALLDPLDC